VGVVGRGIVLGLRWAPALGCVAVVACLASASLAVNGTSTTWTVAGSGASGNTGDGDQAREAAIDQPRSIFAVTGGGVVWAQPWTHRARIVDASGVVTTLTGTGVGGYSGDNGPATAAKVNFVHSVAPTGDGGFLVADTLNSRIRKIDAAGIIRTVAGTGVAGYTGDGGQATSARINNPRGVVALSDGSFLFPDTNNHRVRRVAPNGVITTMAGTGVQGFAGDGGQATAALLSAPFGIAPTADGGFLIVDIGNQRIRKVGPSGTIATVAGTGVKGFSGDNGPATSAQLADPHNVVALPDGGFVVADASNERVRMVDSSGVITTLAGTGVRGFSGDGGPASAAQVSVPKAVGVTSAGDVLVAEEQNNRIRFVGSVVAPASMSAPLINGTAMQGRTLTANAGGWAGTGPVPSYEWERCTPGCAPIAGASSKTFVPGAEDVGATLRVAVTATNSAGASTATSAETATVVAPVAPPTNTSPPTITGAPVDGQPVTVDEGTWSGTQPIAFAYQWRRCDAGGGACTDIAGATAKTYLVSGADVGSTLRARVTGSNDGSVYATAVTDDAPSHYWRFGGTGALVDSVGATNGSFIGAPTLGASGLLVGDADTAVAFNGTNQYADVPPATAWTPPAFSLEVLVRPTATPGNRTIWSTQGQFTGWWLNTGPSGNVRIFVGDGSAWRQGPAGPVLQPGVPYHLVATYDAVNARLYVDGQLVSTGPAVTMAPNAGANVMRFAAFSTGPGQYWPGTIDEASFYPSVLSPEEIAAHYQAAITGSLATSAASSVVTGASPSNTGLPVVSGSAQVGSTLSASTGSWSGSQPISYAYRWQRCTGGSCVDLAGETASTYVVASADLGSTLRIGVTASNATGSSEAFSAETGVVAGAPVSPAFVAGTSAPIGSSSFVFARPTGVSAGDVLVGWVATDTTHVVGAPPPGWSQVGSTQNDGSDSSVSAFWRVVEAGDPASWSGSFGSGEVGIAGVVAYRNVDQGSPIDVFAQGRSGFGSVSSTSSITPSGDARVVLALFGGDPGSSSRSGTPDQSPTAAERLDAVNDTKGFAYAEDVTQASAAPISLDVTWDGGESSANFALALRAPGGPATLPSNTGLPVVSGTAEVGQSLSVSDGSWSGSPPISFAYQWRRCDASGGACVDVAGATGSSYVLVAGDVGATLRAVVTASNGAGSASATSAQSGVVAAQPSSGTLTFSVAAGADDGDLAVGASQSLGYPPSGAPAVSVTGSVLTAGRRAVFGEFEVNTALLRFDTSGLPDGATVSSATLKVFVSGKADADNRELVAEWYAASSWPIDAADFSLDSTGSALAGADITSLATGSVNSFALVGLSAVSTTGSTGLRLHVSGAQPVGDNFVQIASLEHASNPEAQLVVSYTLGG
jgi:Concanavalin A-like lectin/glucanases superfamily